MGCGMNYNCSAYQPTIAVFLLKIIICTLFNLVCRRSRDCCGRLIRTVSRTTGAVCIPAPASSPLAVLSQVQCTLYCTLQYCTFCTLVYSLIIISCNLFQLPRYSQGYKCLLEGVGYRSSEINNFLSQAVVLLLQAALLHYANYILQFVLHAGSCILQCCLLEIQAYKLKKSLC